MVTKQEWGICTIESQRLIAFVLHGLAGSHELVPCCRSSDAAVIKDIFIIEHAAYRWLLGNTWKESGPFSRLIVEYSVALVSVSGCLCHICQISNIIDIVLGDSGVVVFKHIELFLSFQCGREDVLGFTAFPLELNLGSGFSLESLCSLLKCLSLRLIVCPHGPVCKFNTFVLLVSLSRGWCCSCFAGLGFGSCCCRSFCWCLCWFCIVASTAC